MKKYGKKIFVSLLIMLCIFCYVLCFTVPYLQTFGQGYVFVNQFYARMHITNFISDFPDRCLTLDGRILEHNFGNNNVDCVSRVICRVPLTKLNFDNLFQGGVWTHRNIDAEWLRENSKAAWVGYALRDGRISLQYILKLNDGNVVVCYGSALTWQGIGELSLNSAEYYFPCGSIQEFYEYIDQ